MATAQRLSVDETHCVLCCEDMEFSACGACDHPICLKCCVKLRLLRKEFECPVCRANLREVIVSNGYKSYADKLSRRTSPHSRNFGIYHETRESQVKVDKLLEHRCPECDQVFKSFNSVKDHVRKAHTMMYCDICLRHLKIFTHERKCYTREAMVKHRKEGDADDKSHRGHPLCHFCDERYLDNDELLAHLRKTHFWCHLCEKDGSQDYYPNYKELRKHFSQMHFLCEEGECLHEKFTSVFRVKVDYQAHVAQKHSQRLSKAEARQMRQLDVKITFNPRENSDNVSAQDFSFPDQNTERYTRERSSRMTSNVGGRGSLTGESRDSTRHKGKERETLHEASNVNAKVNSEQHREINHKVRGTKEHRGVNIGNGGHKIVKRDKKSPKEVLESDHKRPPGEAGTKENERIFEQSTGHGVTSGRKSCEKIENGKEDVNNSKKMSDLLKLSLNESCIEINKDRGGLSKNHEDARTSGKKLENTFKAKQKDVAFEVSMVERALDLNQDFPDLPGEGNKKAMKVVPKPRLSYDSEFPTLSSEAGQQNMRPPPGFAPAVFTSDLLKQNKTQLKANPGLELKSEVSSSSGASTKAKQDNKVEKSLVNATAVAKVQNGQVLTPTYESEFPTLEKVKAPPGLAPPGFQSRMQAVRPPPGMGWSVPLEIGATKNTRNQKLTSDIRRILNLRGGNFDKFREISGCYRLGSISAEKYYEQCCELLGEDLPMIFQELIDLLPDEEKQRELLLVYNDAKVKVKSSANNDKHFKKTFTNNSVDSAKDSSGARTLTTPTLEDEHFPALTKTSGKRNKSAGKVTSAWTRGK